MKYLRYRTDNRVHQESGYVIIEAALALPVFMFGFLFILSFITVIRAERAVQLGIDKAASEIASYCCMTGDAEIFESELFEKTPEQICRAVSVKNIKDNDRIGLLKKTSGFSADRIDFSGSEIMDEDDKIQIHAEYEVRPWTFGIFNNNMTLKMKNSAVTIAFNGTEKRRDDADSSIWDELPFRRGEMWADIIKSENSDRAVKKGYGIDLYSETTGRVSQVFSMDLFSVTYSKKTGADETSPGDYTIREKNVENRLREYAAELIKNNERYGDKIYKHMEKGTGTKCEYPSEKPELIIIVPEDVKDNSEMENSLKKAADSVSEKHGVSCSIIFREKALKGGEK